MSLIMRPVLSANVHRHIQLTRTEERRHLPYPPQQRRHRSVGQTPRAGPVALDRDGRAVGAEHHALVGYGAVAAGPDRVLDEGVEAVHDDVGEG